MKYSQLVCKDPDVYRIEVPFENYSTNATNVYAVRDGDDCLIVDTGAPTETALEYFNAAMDELGVNLAQAQFFLTHSHLDHAGLIQEVIPEGAMLYIGEEEYRRTQRDQLEKRKKYLGRRFHDIGVSDADIVVFRNMVEEAHFFIPDSIRVQTLSDGDEVRCGRYVLQVVDTAGHTFGHTSLFEPSKNVFFGGDHVLFLISPSVDSFKVEGGSMQKYLDNLKKLLDMPIELFLHSHGPLRDDFKDRITHLIRHHQQRIDQALVSIGEMPGASALEIIQHMAWNVPSGSWEDIHPLQRSIIIVQGLSILDHLSEKGCIRQVETEKVLLGYSLC